MRFHWLSFGLILCGVTSCEENSTNDRSPSANGRSDGDLVVERQSAGECQDGEYDHGNGDACYGDEDSAVTTAAGTKKIGNKPRKIPKDPPGGEEDLPVLDPAAEGDPNIIVFRITSGTGTDNWNTRASRVQVGVGQTLRIVNDDTIIHRLHTNGTPCDHGPDIQVGTSFDCEIEGEHDPDSDGVLYDHRAGSSSEFWVEATE